MENFWKGAFAPIRKANAGCEHGQTAVSIGEPEFGVVPVYVEFNHTCNGRPAPSNSTTYTYEYELDNFVDGEDQEAADIQTMLNNMSDSDRLKWINENLLSTQTVDASGNFW